MEKKYIATAQQLNIILQLVQELPLKQSLASYNVIQEIIQNPYLEPIKEDLTAEKE